MRDARIVGCLIAYVYVACRCRDRVIAFSCSYWVLMFFVQVVCPIEKEKAKKNKAKIIYDIKLNECCAKCYEVVQVYQI